MRNRNNNFRAGQTGRGRRCDGAATGAGLVKSGAPSAAGKPIATGPAQSFTANDRARLPRPSKTFFAPAAAPVTWLVLACLLVLPTLVSAQATDLLGEALADPARQGPVAAQLTTLRRSQYEPEAVGLLARLLATEELAAAGTFVKIAGFLQREDLLDNVSERLRERADVRRAINLARVRCGNTGRRDNLLKNLRKITVDDEFAYTVVPLLIYTRDRSVFDYLWELAITENKNCHPADAEAGGRIDCAYRIVEYLGTAISDFPVPVDDGPNLIAKDYANALLRIRRWYAANADTYAIDTQTY